MSTKARGLDPVISTLGCCALGLAGVGAGGVWIFENVLDEGASVEDAVLAVLLFGAIFAGAFICGLGSAACLLIRLMRHGWRMPWTAAVPGLLCATVIVTLYLLDATSG